MGRIDPRLSGFESTEAAASHDRWFCAKVEKALQDTRPSMPHNEAMTRIDAAIAAAERRRA